MPWFKKVKKQFDDTPGNREYAGKAKAALAGFAAGEPAAEVALVGLLRPLIRTRIWNHWEGLRFDRKELEARCFERLIEWRHKGILRLDEPLPWLVKRLVKQEAEQMIAEDAQQERNAREHVLEPRPAAAWADQTLDMKTLAERVMALAREKMSAGRVAALEAAMAEEEGGPPIEETLGVARKTAQREVQRARAELVAVCKEGGLLDDVVWNDRGGHAVVVETEVSEDEEDYG